MKEQICDIWTKPVVVVTTNGIVKNDGELVMGAGVALAAKQRYPELPKMLGDHVKQNGNVPALFAMKDRLIFSFPTKHHWKEDSDFNLIVKSAVRLVKIVNEASTIIHNVYMTRPGCGYGRRDWSDVKPILETILDDRFIVCIPPKK